jgi:hypothetical protein
VVVTGRNGGELERVRSYRPQVIQVLVMDYKEPK